MRQAKWWSSNLPQAQDPEKQIQKIDQEELIKRKNEDKMKQDARYKHFFDGEERRKSMIVYHQEFFEHNIKEKNLENFLVAVDIFKKKNRSQLYIDFIYASLLKMDEYNANKSLDAYKSLLSVFPVGPYVVKSKWQMDNMHNPRQQNCAIAILEHMEQNFVCPDEELERMCIERFGDWTHVVRKVKRQLYWIPKFKNANKYPLPSPDKLDDPLELGIAAIKR
jgi:signaling intermediate in Toll pathway protein